MSELKTLKERNEAEYQCTLLINSDETEVFLQIARLDPSYTLSLAQLREWIDEVGVVYGLNINALKDLVEKSGAGELEGSEENHLVAKGKPAKHAEDGYLDFMIKPSEENVRLEVDEDEVIDYKNVNLVQNVSAEQHLATVVNPCEPKQGVDVYGKPIQAKEGQAIKVKIGSNIAMDGNKMFATANGRFIQDGDQFWVDPVYLVRGDIDYTIGNINFIGEVKVSKDILDDFSVFAKEGITVDGIVGAANVESDGDIVLNGGMNGKGKGFIRSQKSIESKYYNELTSVSWGDVEIQKSVMNSIVKTKGKLNVQHGSIIGGEVSALMGIDAGVVGSDLGTMTSLVAGQDYELQDKMKAFESQLLELGEEIDRIDRIIGPLLADKNKLMALPLDKKKALKGLLEQLKRYREEQTRVKEEVESLQDEATTSSVKEIIVRKIIYSGVKITIGGSKKLIKMDVKGPVRIREDVENDSISITSISL
jgi:uncharacterized protein (DUF342 family)